MKRPRLLLVDDEREFCADLGAVLESRYEVVSAHEAATALQAVADHEPDLVLLDVELESGELAGVRLLEQIRAGEPAPPVIMLSGNRRVDTVVAAMQLGAFHYVTKPVEPVALVHMIEWALAAGCRVRQIQAQRDELGRLTGTLICGDESMHRVLAQADTVAASTATVLITGESGTGKEMIARRIHDGSPRREGPFVGINCAAFPPNLIESEIFGHAARAFTDAALRVGKLEMAAGGTFFLDEVGEAPLDLQLKLLRALGERVFSRLGENTERTVDCRVIAATSRDLEQAIGSGAFREDLYYRLNIYRIHLPPLRQRPGDVLVLAQHFLDRFSAENGRAVAGFSAAVEGRIQQEAWRGNVRELRNFVERAVINCRGGLISLGDMFGPEAVAAAPGADNREDEPLPTAARRAKSDRERIYCANRLRETGGNVTRAAALSGVPRPSFQRKLKELGLDPREFVRGE